MNEYLALIQDSDGYTHRVITHAHTLHEATAGLEKNHPPTAGNMIKSVTLQETDPHAAIRTLCIARGYAAGRRDAKPELTQQDTPDPTAFAEAYWRAVREEAAGQRIMRPALADAWEDYRETGKIN